jgi:hypothetical protein
METCPIRAARVEGDICRLSRHWPVERRLS